MLNVHLERPATPTHWQLLAETAAVVKGVLTAFATRTCLLVNTARLRLLPARALRERGLRRRVLASRTRFDRVVALT